MKIDFGKLNERVDKDIEELRDERYKEFIEYVNLKYAYKIGKETMRFNSIFPEIQTYISNEKLISIVLDFFRTVDEDMYKKTMKIISGQGTTSIEIYEHEETEKKGLYSKHESSRYSGRTENKTFYKSIIIRGKEYAILSRGENKIYIKKKNTIRDVYQIAHEISHSFIEDKYNSTEDILGEVTSACIEKMLDYYLYKRKISNIKGIYNLRKMEMISAYNLSNRDNIRIQLANKKEKCKVNYDKNNIYYQNDETVFNVIRKIISDENSIKYNTRYVIADLVSNNFDKQYRKNPKEAIIRFKNYINQVKEDNIKGAFNELGLEFTSEGIDRLIEERKADKIKLNKMEDFYIKKGAIRVDTNYPEELLDFIEER